MDTDLPQIERSKLMRQSTDVAGLNATLVGKAGNLNAAICREVINQTGVHYVAAERIWRAGFQCIDDAGSILAAMGMGEVLIVHKAFSQCFPILNLNAAAARILIQRNIKLLDQFRMILLMKYG